MSVMNDSRNVFEAVKERYRLLRIAAVTATGIGAVLVAFILFEWFVRGISHEVIAIVAAAAILLGIQLFMLTALTNMLILLYEEQRVYLEGIES